MSNNRLIQNSLSESETLKKYKEKEEKP